MMAHTCYLTWAQRVAGTPDNFFAVRRERVIMQPCFMGTNDASTLFNAIDGSVPELSIASLLSLQVPLVVLSLGGDLDSSNVRLKYEAARRLAEHNTRVASHGRGRGCGPAILLDIFCTGASQCYQAKPTPSVPPTPSPYHQGCCVRQSDKAPN
jgi:hypothetical protein